MIPLHKPRNCKKGFLTIWKSHSSIHTSYHWAISTPLCKIYYHLSVTGLSVIAALCIGLIELTQKLSLLISRRWYAILK